MNDARPDVLLTGRMMPFVEEQLALSFRPHTLGKDDDAILARVRAIATAGGHRPVDAAFMQKLPKLEIIANFGVGYDTVDAGWAGKHGIIVTNTPDVLNDEVADTALGLLLATVRELPQAERHLRAGKWLVKQYPLTSTLRDRTIGLVGMGRIGKAIAKRLAAFGLPIVYHSRNPAAGVPWKHYPDLVAMARDVDVLIVIVPGGPATRHLINRDVLAALGPKGVLINVARGSVVDEAALIEALQNKTIQTAGLDVFANEPHVPPELTAMEHIVLLPHLGSSTHHTRRAMGQLVVDNLTSWFSGKGPLTPVAETPWPPRG